MFRWVESIDRSVFGLCGFVYVGETRLDVVRPSLGIIELGAVILRYEYFKVVVRTCVWLVIAIRGDEWLV